MTAPRIYFDGEARPSRKGLMRACVIYVGGHSADVRDVPTGRGSSEDAEWLAFLMGVELALGMGLRRATFIGDNLGVINAVLGIERPKKPETRWFADRAATLLVDKPAYTARHVRRDLNLAGRFLECGDGPAFRSGLSLLEGADRVWFPDHAARGRGEPARTTESAP